MSNNVQTEVPESYVIEQWLKGTEGDNEIHGGAGNDLITDFEVGTDRIDIAKFDLTWAELSASIAADDAGNAVIALAHPSDPAKAASITLEGVTVDALGADAFLL